MVPTLFGTDANIEEKRPICNGSFPQDDRIYRIIMIILEILSSCLKLFSECSHIGDRLLTSVMFANVRRWQAV